jgi:hypothetical protein
LDGERGIDVLPVKGEREVKYKRNREREGDRDGDQGNSASREIYGNSRREASGIRKQRRMSRLLQGPMRKYRKL